MKAMLSAFVVMGLISVGAYYGLRSAGFETGEIQSSPSVRLD